MTIKVRVYREEYRHGPTEYDPRNYWPWYVLKEVYPGRPRDSDEHVVLTLEEYSQYQAAVKEVYRVMDIVKRRLDG